MRNLIFGSVISVFVSLANAAPVDTLTLAPDEVEKDAREYSHEKRTGEVTAFALLNSFKYRDDQRGEDERERSERFGAGLSVVLKSFDHMLFDLGLVYQPTGFKTLAGQIQADYFTLPLSFRFFLLPQNLGVYFKTGLAPSYLIGADDFERNFANWHTQVWLGAGGVFPTKMTNAIAIELVWVRSFDSALRSENLKNESAMAVIGLTL